MNMTGVVNNITNITNTWRHTTIKRILTNPIYIGMVVQNKRKKISYKSKKMISLPKEQHTVTKDHHPAIIDIDTWNTVQSMFKNHIGEKIKEEDPLLKSLLHCYHCHNKLQIVKKNDKYKDKVKVRKYVIVSTASRKVTNKICNNKNYIKYENLETKVGAIKGITTSSTVTEEGWVPDAASVNARLNVKVDRYDEETKTLYLVSV